MFELVRDLLAIVGLLTVLALLLAAAWLGLGEPMDEHWPMGLDEDPTLNVTNGIGDSRPIQSLRSADPSRQASDYDFLQDFDEVSYFTEEQAEAFVDRHFDRLPDGSVTSDRSAARIADRLSRMAARYFG